jgi:putative phosphoesterase
MLRIGLLSDTHGWFPDRVLDHFRECDEIWHAGDIGTTQVIDKLEAAKPCRMIFGNIDGMDVRKRTAENLVFTAEGIKVAMTHIGGSPGKYSPAALQLIRTERPKLFICGHSHILKVQYDKTHSLLYMNPGAAGNHGWHKMITVLRFTLDAGKIGDVEVIELGPRGRLN